MEESPDLLSGDDGKVNATALMITFRPVWLPNFRLVSVSCVDLFLSSF